MKRFEAILIAKYQIQGRRRDQNEPTPIDPIILNAARLIVMARTGSLSMLQRKMGITIEQSNLLMNLFETLEIVGRDRGDKPREVLMDEFQLEQLISRLGRA